jgi:transcriptional regulator with XRE-family HTH domain
MTVKAKKTTSERHIEKTFYNSNVIEEIILPRPPKTVLISKEEIGRRLRTIRLERGLSQTELADKLGVTQPNISAVEIGRRGITIQQLVKLCRVLHVSPDEILALGEGNAKKERRKRKKDKILRRLELMEKLPLSDQRAILAHLDALLKSRGIGPNGSRE